jgi:hypothetical protein
MKEVQVLNIAIWGENIWTMVKLQQNCYTLPSVQFILRLHGGMEPEGSLP